MGSDIHTDIIDAVDRDDADALNKVLNSISKVEDRIDLMYQPIYPVNWKDTKLNLDNPGRPILQSIQEMANTPLLRCLYR